MAFLFFFLKRFLILCTSLDLMFSLHHVYILHCEQQISVRVRLEHDAEPPVFHGCLVGCLSVAKFHHNLLTIISITMEL